MLSECKTPTNKLTETLNHSVCFVCLLFLYVLATSKVISGRVPTCGSMCSWHLYSAAPLGDQASSKMAWYPTPVTLSLGWANQSLPYPNNAECLARKICIDLKVIGLTWPGFELARSESPDLPKRQTDVGVVILSGPVILYSSHGMLIHG